MGNGWFWCLHCERVGYGSGEDCPYCGAGGLDLMEYETDGFFMGGFPDGWPSSPPEEGTRLPLYPPTGWQFSE